MSSPGGSTIGRVSVKVVPDTSKFRQELKKQLDTKLKDFKVEIPVKADTTKAQAQLALLKKKIDALDKNVKINVDQDGDLSKKLSKIGDSASSAGEGFSSMSRFALIGVAVLVLLAPALALIATLLAGLPSLLFLLGAAFAAVGLGMDGIKKAAEVFGPSIEKLKASLSATFEKGLTPVFQQLNSIFPVLEAGLNRVADGLIVMAQGFTNVVTSAAGMAQIETFLANTGKFFEQITPGIESFTRILLTLASEGSKLFGELGHVINEFTNSFEQMINSAVASGTFAEAIKGLAEVTGTLLNVFTQLFGAGLQAMTILGGPISNLLQGFGDALVALMPALTILSEVIFNLLGNALKALVPIITALMPAFNQLAEVFFQLVDGALTVLAPLLKIVADVLGTILLAALTAIQPLIPPLIQILTQLADVIGKALMDALVVLMPLINALIQFIVQLVQALLPLLPPLVELAAVIFQALMDILIQLMPHIMRIATEIFPLLLDAVKALVPVLINVIEKLIEFIPPFIKIVSWIIDKTIPAFQSLMDIVVAVIGPIKDIIAGAFNFIAGVIDFFTGLVSGNWDQMWRGLKTMAKSALDVLLGVIEGALKVAVEFFIGLPLRIIGAFGDLGGLLKDSGRKLIQGFLDGIGSMIQAAKNKAASVVQAVRDFFPFSPAKVGPFSGTGYTTYSGEALMNDWAKGMEAGTPRALRAIEDVMGQTQTAMDIEAAVSSEGFGSIGDKVAGALEGWTVELDANGVTRLVNRTNRRNERR
jgi:phage-related protein